MDMLPQCSLAGQAAGQLQVYCWSNCAKLRQWCKSQVDTANLLQGKSSDSKLISWKWFCHTLYMDRGLDDRYGLCLVSFDICVVVTVHSQHVCLYLDGYICDGGYILLGV